MCKWGNTILCEVTIPASNSYTGKDRKDMKPIDSCIASIIEALNISGIRTDASCCGHNKEVGWIVLHDGRKLNVIENDRKNCIIKEEEEK